SLKEKHSEFAVAYIEIGDPSTALLKFEVLGLSERGSLSRETCLETTNAIISRKGRNAWWYMLVEELLPEKYSDKASGYVTGTDTLDV
ncbi:hypothetical protein Tco_0996125, partial [Tanacetum coccineum]